MGVEKLEFELKRDNETFEEKRRELIKKHYGMWVTVFKGEIASIGKTYDESARKAREKFGEKTMVTRQVVPEEEERYWILRGNAVRG